MAVHAAPQTAVSVRAQASPSAAMMRSLRVLQMNGAELREFAREEARENPFLDYAPPAQSGGEEDPAVYAEDEPCLYEDILRQIYAAFPDGAKHDIALFFAERLDGRGFCAAGAADAARALRLPEEECEAVLRTLRGFEPEGVFSDGIQSCIAYRLKARGLWNDAARKALDALPVIARKGVRASAKEAGLSPESLAEALNAIKMFRAPPACGYASPPVRTRIADCLIVLSPEGEPSVLPNPAAGHGLSLSGDISFIEGKDVSEETREQAERARELCAAAGRREETVILIAAAVAEAQKAFFRYGAAFMRPLTLADIAAKTGLHESTVSRASREKCLSFHDNIYDLKYFFGAGTENDGGALISAEAAKTRLQALIDAEPPEAPYADEALAELLAREGICISRRTAVKYRNALGIPSSAVRKKQKFLSRKRDI